MDFNVETDVPMPTGRTGRPSKWRDLMTQVKHGDSIVLSERERNSLQGSLCRTNKESGFRIISRKVDELHDGEPLYRVWFQDKSVDAA